MSRYWSNLIKNIEPYTPGEQPDDKKYIKLNTNENPYPPSPRVIEAVKRVANESLKLYPSTTCDELKSAIAWHYGIEKEQVFVGNGSDEVLAFSFMAFFNPGRHILFPDITYSFYPVYSSLFNIDYRLIPLDDDFSVTVEGFCRDNGGIVIANPNAPTGKYLPLESIEKILQCNSGSVVIIDEAYIDFGGESALKLVNEYPNLLIIQTVSKSRSLAGLRVGYAMGHKELILGLGRVKNSINSYTLDRIALAGAVEAFRDEACFRENCQKIIRTRENAVTRLKAMNFSVIDSKANFVFISHPSICAETLLQRLRERGILVRYFNKPRIDNYIRVSIGSDDEMDIALKAMEEIILLQ